jgi:catechol 2,3-dioxygenase-like lactoylglutathione lyase family enzyme
MRWIASSLLALTTIAAAIASAQNAANVPPPAYTDPATLLPGSKAVARRVTMLVSDLEQAKRFYEALGFKEDRRTEVRDAASLRVFGLPAGTHLTFIRMTNDNTLSTGHIDGGTLGFAQVHNRKLKLLRAQTRGTTMIGTPILIMTTDAVDAIHDRLVQIDAEVLEPPFMLDGGFKTMVVRDPDGTRMEITQPPTGRR